MLKLINIIYLYICNNSHISTLYIVAIHYGKYLSKEEVLSNVKYGDKLDILCTDGLNYIVEVKKHNNDNGIGHLHFSNWSYRLVE